MTSLERLSVTFILESEIFALSKVSHLTLLGLTLSLTFDLEFKIQTVHLCLQLWTWWYCHKTWSWRTASVSSHTDGPTYIHRYTHSKYRMPCAGSSLMISWWHKKLTMSKGVNLLTVYITLYFLHSWWHMVLQRSIGATTVWTGRDQCPQLLGWGTNNVLDPPTSLP